MPVFDFSVLGIVALLIALKLLVLAARMLAERAHGRRLALSPVPLRRPPTRPGS
jgi:hypothetical protein